MTEENKNLEENIKRHIDVMLEAVRSDFKVFGEGLMDVSKKVDLLAEDMDYVKSDIVDIKVDIKMMKKDIVELKSDVSVLKSDVSLLQSDVSVLKSDVGEIKEDLKIKADKEDVKGHEIRIAKLENTALAKA